jgi:hypothetical protein
MGHKITLAFTLAVMLGVTAEARATDVRGMTWEEMALRANFVGSWNVRWLGGLWRNIEWCRCGRVRRRLGTRYE